MKVLRKIVEIDQDKCDGCGLCVPACAEGAIVVEGGKARLVSERFCDGLGACLGECPKDAIKIVEREAEDFDEEAVHEYLKSKRAGFQQVQSQCCPVEVLSASVTEGGVQGEIRSALGNWPIKIELVPKGAVFLKDAHLLITADCAPVAYPALHNYLLPGKVLLIGCPKLGDIQVYYKKLVDIFKENQLKGITVLRMEVPCCSALTGLVKKALKEAGLPLKVEEVVVGTRGQVLSTTNG